MIFDYSFNLIAHCVALTRTKVAVYFVSSEVIEDVFTIEVENFTLDELISKITEEVKEPTEPDPEFLDSELCLALFNHIQQLYWPDAIEGADDTV